MDSKMDLSTILRYIESEKCVLLVGSELPFISSNSNRQQLIYNCLTEGGLEDLSQFKEDDFFYFPHPQARHRTKACNALINLYEGFEVNELYRKIAKIPFSMIISLSPDVLIKKTFLELFGENSFDFGYYKKNDNREFKSPASKSRPAIYNLLGDISQDEDSVILTFDDLFNFFSGIFGNYQLPSTIKKKLMDAKYFVFIGFKFHAWYYKLLLRILEITENKLTYYYPDSSSIGNYNADQDDKVLLFFEQHFKMELSPYNVTEFISELYNQCDQRKMLRTRASVVIFDNISFKNLIGDNNIERAIFQMKEYLLQTKNNEQYNTFSTIISDFKNFQEAVMQGRIGSEESQIRRSIIISKLLKLGDELIN